RPGPTSFHCKRLFIRSNLLSLRRQDPDSVPGPAGLTQIVALLPAEVNEARVALAFFGQGIELRRCFRRRAALEELERRVEVLELPALVVAPLRLRLDQLID